MNLLIEVMERLTARVVELAAEVRDLRTKNEVLEARLNEYRQRFGAIS